jgi:hypothetical protein
MLRSEKVYIAPQIDRGWPVNLDHIIQVTVGDEGRAVVHLTGGGSFSTDALYAISRPDWYQLVKLMTRNLYLSGD